MLSGVIIGRSSLERSSAFVQNHNRFVNISTFDAPDRDQNSLEQRNFVVRKYDHTMKTSHTTEFLRLGLELNAGFPWSDQINQAMQRLGGLIRQQISSFN